MKTTQSLTNKIMQLEKKYWQAMAGPNGMHSVDRATYEKMFNSGVESVRTFEFDGAPEVRFLNDDTVVCDAH